MNIEESKLKSIRNMSNPDSKELYIPISIFKNKSSLLGAITTYLKDNLKLKNADIARLLNKNYKSTWYAYKKNEKKK